MTHNKKAVKSKTYHKVCGNLSCKKKFTTKDSRQKYHDKGCSQKVRSKRWVKRAVLALRQLRKLEAKGAKVIRAAKKAVNKHKKHKTVKARKTAHKTAHKAVAATAAA